MNRREPSERFWMAVKRTAVTERGTITYAQAVKRVRKIAADEGMDKLPAEALTFYAEEYVRMVRDTER